VADDRKERFAAFKAKFDSVSFLSRLSRLLRLGLRPGSALKFGLLTVTLTSMKPSLLSCTIPGEHDDEDSTRTTSRKTNWKQKGVFVVFR
jgi:hypothetical protein